MAKTAMTWMSPEKTPSVVWKKLEEMLAKFLPKAESPSMMPSWSSTWLRFVVRDWSSSRKPCSRPANWVNCSTIGGVREEINKKKKEKKKRDTKNNDKQRGNL